MAERSGRSEWEELHCRTCRAPACAPVPCPVDLGASRSERKLGSSMQTERPSWSQPRIAESCVRGAPFCEYSLPVHSTRECAWIADAQYAKSNN